ncbi:MAG: NUDIX domain-containing protein [Patescibacteria group bacterium]|jgi:bifunctional NMN adenylyltransferase/nudix hydrolase
MPNGPAAVGVVVARFQVPELTLGHQALIEFVESQVKQVLLVLGTSEAFATSRNPLSFAARREMVLASYPNVKVVSLADHPSDSVWSTNLDQLIKKMFPDQSVSLYGSRDSFLTTYSGTLPVVDFPALPCLSGTENRVALLDNPPTSPDFRKGIVYSQVARAGIPYATVDIAIVDENKGLVLLGGKPTDGDRYRFIGGFVDVNDESLERAAKREAYEETGGLEIDDLRYFGSAKVVDWRYQGTGDGILTSFFAATYIFGCAKAQDDIARVKWVPIKEVKQYLVPEHQILGSMLLKQHHLTR